MGEFKQYIVVIDPGHGGDDYGAMGEYSNEKDINLSISKKLYNALLCDERFIPVLTRIGDQSILLQDRVKESIDANANVFLSIHCNASTNKRAHDSQVYFYNEVKDKPLADLIHAYTSNVDKRYSKWSRVEFGNYFVLRKQNTYPVSAVLLEVAFISNKQDEDLLNDDSFQIDYAQAVYHGIKAFFNII